MGSFKLLHSHAFAKPYVLPHFHLMICFLASQRLYPRKLTKTSITVSYTAKRGVIGSYMVARNGKLSRFYGRCDAARRTCTVNGLSAGSVFEIWVRTCIGIWQYHCALRAMPAQMATYPKGMS